MFVRKVLIQRLDRIGIVILDQEKHKKHSANKKWTVSTTKTQKERDGKERNPFLGDTRRLKDEKCDPLSLILLCIRLTH